MCKIGNAVMFYDGRTGAYRSNILRCFRSLTKREVLGFAESGHPTEVWIEATMQEWNGCGYAPAKVLKVEENDGIFRIQWDTEVATGETIVVPGSPERSNLFVLAKPEKLEAIISGDHQIIQGPKRQDEIAKAA